MESEHGLSPEEMGVENTEDNVQATTETENLPLLNNEVSGRSEATPSSVGNEAANPTANQNGLTQKSAAPKPVMGGAPKTALHSSSGGESVLKSFADIAEGIEEESGLDNLTK